ncbi:MAG: cytochrome-c peroxidase, partial [Cytophagales bacterium]|nr:cytochrome-c peroxidase [Cytophagales bacterium]
MKSFLLPVKVIILSVLFSACNPSDPIVEASDIDKELENQLATSSGGLGKSYYILPESDDFANIPQDPLNPITKEKVVLCQILFHETGIGQNPKNRLGMNTYSSAS